MDIEFFRDILIYYWLTFFSKHNMNYLLQFGSNVSFVITTKNSLHWVLLCSADWVLLWIGTQDYQVKIASTQDIFFFKIDQCLFIIHQCPGLLNEKSWWQIGQNSLDCCDLTLEGAIFSLLSIRLTSPIKLSRRGSLYPFSINLLFKTLCLGQIICLIITISSYTYSLPHGDIFSHMGMKCLCQSP